MSASGRPNPLDRLVPVAELPDRRSGAAGADPDSPSRSSETDDPVRPAAEPEHPGWGIGGMPTWLDTPPVRTPRRRTDPDDATDATDAEEDDETDDDPIPRRRFAVAPPAALALIAVGVVVCAVAAVGLFRGSESAPVVDFGAVAGTSRVPVSSPPAPPTESTPTLMVVSVVGLVHQPGLVRLAPGARVAEAIDRAGGVRKNADLLSLNLAQVLRDGDQILVGYAGGEGQMSLRSAVVGASGAPSAPAGAAPTGPGPPAGGTGSPPDPNGLVNLNTATEADLDELPGVGPVTAKAILSWRERNGRFTSVDQLAEVDGIGPARLARLRDLVTV
ncbi:ComEA family DNA-binding protein [Gordonia lacunae]|uniref:Competence protein ComEA n=1 Tax=Gordonia lacunae TaxID=417102 RepID=A0A243Q7J5_9ACTN|nr:ComEA family DNA-binding protein [Gordonia lacunae]OUC77491.1 competence protein ComEA [Gordonia lacunae]